MGWLLCDKPTVCGRSTCCRVSRLSPIPFFSAPSMHVLTVWDSCLSHASRVSSRLIPEFELPVDALSLADNVRAFKLVPVLQILQYNVRAIWLQLIQEDSQRYVAKCRRGLGIRGISCLPHCLADSKAQQVGLHRPYPRACNLGAAAGGSVHRLSFVCSELTTRVRQAECQQRTWTIGTRQHDAGNRSSIEAYIADETVGWLLRLFAHLCAEANTKLGLADIGSGKLLATRCTRNPTKYYTLANGRIVHYASLVHPHAHHFGMEKTPKLIKISKVSVCVGKGHLLLLWLHCRTWERSSGTY